MPEGHSIHRLARQLNDVFSGQRLAASSPQGRFAEGAALLDGRSLVRAAAHGKQLFVEFDGGVYLRVHLGLYGAFSFGGDERFAGASSIGAPRRIGEVEAAAEAASTREYSGPPDPVGQVRLRLVGEHGWADLRGASACELLTEAEVAAVRAKLGPDPIAEPTAGRDAFRRSLGTRASIAVVLMDQKRVAGVGNIYRAEALFRCGLDPAQEAAHLGSAAADALWDELCRLMADGVRDGRIITTDPEDRPFPEQPAWPEQAHYVYGRAGQSCRRCGELVSVAELAARKLYWCPGCQVH